MEKNKTFKILVIVGLVVAVVGLAIGFAAFSATLNISTFNATAKAGDADAVFGNLVTFQNDAACTVSTGSTATATAGTATDHTWNGITATFTKPGDIITCTATIKNTSDYTAYLTKLSTNGSMITCSGSAQNKDDVCKSISGSVSIGDNKTGFTSTTAAKLASPSATIASTTGTTTATVILTYSSTGAIPDADVTVTIPTIETVFATAK